MEIFFIKAFQLILCLSLLIVLHEGGHFLFAKLFKIRVEKFCLFFDPWKSWKLFSFRGTDYHIGWLPLGGYVKISGMIDESMDTEAMKQPVQSWEFRAKPAWQRLFVMIGGVLVNFLFAMFIYAMILFTWGEQFIPIEKMNQGFEYNKSALALGFQDGDIPIRTNQGDLERFNGNAIRMISEASSVTVLRNGTEVEITTPGNLNLLEMLQSQPPFIAPRCPALIDSVLPKSPAQTAGLKKGDRILAFNQENIDSWNDFDFCVNDLKALITHYTPNNQTKADSLRQVAMVVQHVGSQLPDTLQVTLNEEGAFGFIKNYEAVNYPITTRHYSFLESFPAGCRLGWEVLSGYVSDLKYLFTAEGAKSIGSFGTIGSMFPSTWDWQSFWELTALISLILAVMNILPIPALDGGHVLFLLYEVITRRKPSDKVMEYMQMIGMWLLIGLMCYAIFNDVVRFVF